METLLKADIFFFITSVVVILLGLLVATLIYVIIMLVRRIDQIAQKVQVETDNVSQDIADIRAYIREEAARARGPLGFVGGLAASSFKSYFKNKMSGASRKTSGSRSRSRPSAKTVHKEDETENE